MSASTGDQSDFRNPKRKTFDCVKMKRDIQAKLMKETAGLSIEERRSRFAAAIRKEPLLSRIWFGGRRKRVS